MPMPRNTPQDVWRYIEKRGADECWPWSSHRDRRGYGVFTIDHRSYKAHRVVFSLENPGQISIGAGPRNTALTSIVMHTCDNPACCNPRHLRKGTLQENTEDMFSKARARKVGPRKLIVAEIERIREALLFGADQYDLAAIYGVSQATISNVYLRKHYTEVA